MIRKKYLFVSRFLKGGGAERFVSVFSSYLADCGYDIHLALYEETETDYPISDKVRIHMMPKRKDNLLGKIFRLHDLGCIIGDIKPDYIIPFLNMVVIQSFLCSLFRKTKFIYTVRIAPSNQIGNKITKKVNKLIVHFSDAIMLQTWEQSEYYPKKYLKKMYVVPNPIAKQFVDNEKDNYSESKASITCVGRLCKQKRFSMVIEVVAELKERFPDLKVNIYGEGELKTELEKQIICLNAEDSCYLRGRTSDIIGVLKSTDIFIMSSAFEGMPNALLEAMAVGVPCISTDCPTGPKDMIKHGINGLLYETDNYEELKETLVWALENRAEMNRLGKNARTDVLAKYTMENSKDKFISMCSNI